MLPVLVCYWSDCFCTGFREDVAVVCKVRLHLCLGLQLYILQPFPWPWFIRHWFLKTGLAQVSWLMGSALSNCSFNELWWLLIEHLSWWLTQALMISNHCQSPKPKKAGKWWHDFSFSNCIQLYGYTTLTYSKHDLLTYSQLVLYVKLLKDLLQAT